MTRPTLEHLKRREILLSKPTEPSVNRIHFVPLMLGPITIRLSLRAVILGTHSYLYLLTRYPIVTPPAPSPPTPFRHGPQHTNLRSKQPPSTLRAPELVPLLPRVVPNILATLPSKLDLLPKQRIGRTPRRTFYLPSNVTLQLLH